MPVPAFDSLGLLPAGVHDATFSEIEKVLCWNSHRADLWYHFKLFISEKCGIFSSNGVSFWIDGSFVRSKDFPSDIDLVLDLSSHADRHDLLAELMLLRLAHGEIKVRYHVDLWGKHPRIPNDLTAFFQYAGDKCAFELHVEPKHPKGILRVIP